MAGTKILCSGPFQEVAADTGVNRLLQIGAILVKRKYQHLD
jgi:hypothetical protein